MIVSPDTLRLPRSVTHDVASSITLAASQSVLSSGGAPASHITVDASALEQFDSSALAVLLDCRRQALAVGQSFTVTGASKRLMKLATLYGVSELIFGTTASTVRAS